MRVLYAMVCENAGTREDGRLDVHGVFHQLYAPGFPAMQDRMMLAATVEWEPAERGQIDFRIDLVDPTGSPVMSVTGHTTVADTDRLAGPPQTRFLLPLDEVRFPVEGTYEFVLRQQEEAYELCPLHLIENPGARAA